MDDLYSENLWFSATSSVVAETVFTVTAIGHARHPHGVALTDFPLLTMVGLWDITRWQ